MEKEKLTEDIRPCIDLNRELVKHPAATFYGRVTGDSMLDAGVCPGDILVIDKSLEASAGDMAVCFIDGEFTLKYIFPEKDCMVLRSSDENAAPIRITGENSFVLWGIVTYIIKKIR